MTTCTWKFRRHAGRLTATFALVAATTGLIAPHASADQLSNLRAKAQADATKIDNLGRQEAGLSEQFDAANLGQRAAATKVSAAAAEVAAADAAANKAKAGLRQEAVDAYTRGGTSGLASSSNNLASANNSLLRAEYVDSLATNQNDAVDQYHLASLQAESAKAKLSAAESEASQQAKTLASSRASVESDSAQLKGIYHQDQGQIAQMVAQIQAQQAAAAAAAARQAATQQAAVQQQAASTQASQAARQQTASTQAGQAAGSSRSGAVPSTSGGGSSSSSGGGGGYTPPNNPAPPVGHGASGAIAAAESRLGAPYVYGASGPGAFDCSGLVMWAYAQAGISLPHYSGAQFSDGTHISMSQLAPGDLVFPSDPGQHVAMYIGNGEIIEAPYTGAVVHITGLSSFFVQAVRIS
ncbi:MAG: C40 family peptidase [Actinomycetota bacterium]|nr:C40 family peptidase [Actinomycetota bacterium]